MLTTPACGFTPYFFCHGVSSRHEPHVVRGCWICSWLCIRFSLWECGVDVSVYFFFNRKERTQRLLCTSPWSHTFFAPRLTTAYMPTPTTYLRALKWTLRAPQSGPSFLFSLFSVPNNYGYHLRKYIYKKKNIPNPNQTKPGQINHQQKSNIAHTFPFLSPVVAWFVRRSLCPRRRARRTGGLWSRAETQRRSSWRTARRKEIHEQIQQPLTTWGSWRLDTPWQKKYGVKPQAGVVNIIDVPMGYPGRFDTWEELTK